MSQIIINILRNAKQATQDQSDRRVHLEVLAAGTQAMIRCQDNGPGFNTESLQKVGQAFFTTKLDGLGLGLSISKAIAEQHQGQLAFDNAPEGGAVVTLLLPMQRCRVAAKPTPSCGEGFELTLMTRSRFAGAGPHAGRSHVKASPTHRIRSL